jgi:PPM family protein phosphatase
VLESALGIGGFPRIGTSTVAIEQGDRIFIASDGLHRKLLLRELKFLSDACASAEQRVAALMQAAIDRQPEDNFTVAALFV